MPEQELNLADVGTLFEQVTGEGVAQRMGRDGFRNLRNQTGLLALQLNRQLTDVLARKLAWEEPVFRLLHSPPGTQDLQELGESMVYLSFFPLPCSTRMTMRLLSMAAGVSAMASEIRRPAA